MHRTLSIRGLTDSQVATRVEAGKTNYFEQVSSRSIWDILRTNALTLFNGIILVCTTVLISIGRIQDAFFVAIALSNMVIGSVQEFKTKQALDKLALLNAPKARVRRRAGEKEVAVADVVLDDILVLRPGDQIPADAIVAQTIDLEVDESMLTGESDAVLKSSGDQVLSGSIVVGGSGLAKVNKVGADSYANKFAKEAKKFSLVSSELNRSINLVLRTITWIIGPLILVVFNSQVLALGGWGQISGIWQDAVVATISSVISMIPLGLILITSISFAVAAVKLGRQKVLVQQLPAVEGLARVDMICLDKTGTLTEGDIQHREFIPLIQKRTEAAKAVLSWYGAQPDANATARSLMTSFGEIPSTDSVATIAFSSKRKWSAVEFSKTAVKGSWVFGAPEMIFASLPPELAVQVTELSGKGYRTLVLARSASSIDGSTLPEGLEPVALLTFSEKIRSDAAETLRYFAEQDVAVKIISGDNPQTVASIARQIGLEVKHGYDARQLPKDDKVLQQVLRDNIVFGRVTPEQKKRIVAMLKEMGHVVAMTGDGVNDTLALKEADMGIAMNSGSSATKAVARLVLLDGKFSRLPKVVDEGRQVIANIERISMLFFTKTTYAVALAIIFGLLVLPYPFLPRQLSIVDALTIGFPAFFLALLLNRQRYQPGFLKRSLSFAIPSGLIAATAVGLFAWLTAGQNIPEAEIRTGAVMLLTVIGIWLLVILSRPVSFVKLGIITLMVGLLIATFWVPMSVNFFLLVALDFSTAVLLVLLVLGAIIGIEIVRFIHRRVHPEAVLVSKMSTPVRLRLLTVSSYVVAYLFIALGILLILARYSPDFIEFQSAVLTIAGITLVYLGFIVLALVSGIGRADQASRVILTVILGVAAVVSLVSIFIFDDIHFVQIAIAIINGGFIAMLWGKRARGYFGAGTAIRK